MSYRGFWITVLVAYTLATLCCFGMHLAGVTTNVFRYNWDWGLFLFLMMGIYTIRGFGIIDPEEKAGLIFLGWYIKDLSPGPAFAPPIISKIMKEKGRDIQMELPADPEKIYRGEGNPDEGMFPPIRITFGPYNPSEGIPEDDPYNRRLTQEVVPIVTVRIKNFKAFYVIIGDREHLREYLGDASVAMLLEEFTKITPAVALRDIAKYNKKLKDAISERVGENGSDDWWGIEIVKAEIKLINFSHTLNEAVQSIAEEVAKKKAGIIQAEGEKQKKILKGEGDGAAEKSLLDGRTAGLKNMVDKLGVSGSEALGAETARGITNNPGQKTIVAGSGGFADLATVGAVIGNSIKKEG